MTRSDADDKVKKYFVWGGAVSGNLLIYTASNYQGFESRLERRGPCPQAPPPNAEY